VSPFASDDLQALRTGSEPAHDDLLRHGLAAALRRLDVLQAAAGSLGELRQRLAEEAFQLVWEQARRDADELPPQLTELLPLLLRWDVRVAGRWFPMLGVRMGSETVAGCLGRRLTEGTKEDRAAARRLLLGLAGALPPPALDELAAFLDAASTEVRQAMLEMLAALGPAAVRPALLQRLARLLREGQPELVGGVLDLLSHLGDAAAEPEIIDALIDLREECAWRQHGGGRRPLAMEDRLAWEQGGARLGPEVLDRINDCLRRLVAVCPAAALARLAERLDGPDAPHARRTLGELRQLSADQTAWAPLLRHLLGLVQTAGEPAESRALSMLEQVGPWAAHPAVVAWLVRRLPVGWPFRRIVLAALCSLGPAAGDSQVVGPTADALYNLLSSWLHGVDHARWAEAVDLLEGIGAPAGRRSDIVDALFDVAGRGNAYWLRRVLRALRAVAPLDSPGVVEQPRARALQILVNLMGDPDPELRRFACRELVEYGDFAAISSVLTPLVRLLDDVVRDEAGRALLVLGPQVRPQDRDVYQARLAEALADPGRCWGALPAVRALLPNLEPALIEAVGALAVGGAGGPSHEAGLVLCDLGRVAQPTLRRVLADGLHQPPDRPAFRRAVHLLPRGGALAADPFLLDPLAGPLREPSSAACSPVLDAVAELGPTALQSAALATALVRLLSAKYTDVLAAALRALGATRLIARRGHVLLWEEAWLAVLRLVRHESPVVRHEAALLLGQAPTAATRLRALQTLLSMPDDEAAPRAAATALIGLGADHITADARRLLAGMLDAPKGQENRRSTALAALAALGPAVLDDGLTRRVIERLNDDSEEVRRQARAAVRRFTEAGVRFVRDGAGGWTPFFGEPGASATGVHPSGR